MRRTVALGAVATILLAGCSGAADSPGSSRSSHVYELELTASKQVTGWYLFPGLSKQQIDDSINPGSWKRTFHHRTNHSWTLYGRSKGAEVTCRITLNGMTLVKQTLATEVTCQS